MLDIFVCLCLELLILHVYVHYLSILWQKQNWLKCDVEITKKTPICFSCRHVIACLQVLRLFWCPCNLTLSIICTVYICLSALGRSSCCLYTYLKNALLSNHFQPPPPALKVCVVSIIEMVDLDSRTDFALFF